VGVIVSLSDASSQLIKSIDLATHVPRALGVRLCLLLNGTSALFRLLVPRIVEIEHTRHVKSDV